MAGNANSITATRRLFLAGGTAATVFAALNVAVAKESSVVESYIADLRAGGYKLRVFGDHYSIVFPDRDLDDAWGKVGAKYGNARKVDPDFHDKVAAALRAEARV